MAAVPWHPDGRGQRKDRDVPPRRRRFPLQQYARSSPSFPHHGAIFNIQGPGRNPSIFRGSQRWRRLHRTAHGLEGRPVWRLVIVPQAWHSISSRPSWRGVANVWLPHAGHSISSNVPSGSGPWHPAGHQYDCRPRKCASLMLISRLPMQMRGPRQVGQRGWLESLFAPTIASPNGPVDSGLILDWISPICTEHTACHAAGL